MIGTIVRVTVKFWMVLWMLVILAIVLMLGSSLVQRWVETAVIR